MYHFPSENNGLGNFDKGYDGIPSEEEFKHIYFKIKNANEPSFSSWYLFQAFNCLRLAGITQGVYKRFLMGNASSPFAGKFLKITIQIANLGKTLALLSQSHNSLKTRIDQLKKKESLFLFFKEKLSERFYETYLKVADFLEKFIYPNEKFIIKLIEKNEIKFNYENFVNNGKDTNNNVYWYYVNEIIENLKAKAKKDNLFNLFLPQISNLTNLEFAFISRLMGRSIFFAPEIFNCNAPDTGNMEILYKFGSLEQKEKYLKPLLNGEIRSCFSMTEKGVPSSDALNIQSTIELDETGEHYIVNGRKWWISGAGDPRCKFTIFLGIIPNKENKDKNTHHVSKHKKHTMIIIPLDTPGINIKRPMKVFGYSDFPHGHMDIVFSNVKVPKKNILLGEGRGFDIAQARLGPGRIHHCMRVIGCAYRALENLIDRASYKNTFGNKFSSNEYILNQIAKSKIELMQSELLVLYTADKIDIIGAKGAKEEIAMIKVSAPATALNIIDRAIQIFGGEGVSQDSFLANTYGIIRTLRIADGPDEVHLRAIGKSSFNNPKF